MLLVFWVFLILRWGLGCFFFRKALSSFLFRQSCLRARSSHAQRMCIGEDASLVQCCAVHSPSAKECLLHTDVQDTSPCCSHQTFLHLFYSTARSPFLFLPELCCRWRCRVVNNTSLDTSSRYMLYHIKQHGKIVLRSYTELTHILVTVSLWLNRRARWLWQVG